jgi:hypothetical protein
MRHLFRRRPDVDHFGPWPISPPHSNREAIRKPLVTHSAVHCRAMPDIAVADGRLNARYFHRGQKPATAAASLLTGIKHAPEQW